MTCTHRKIIKQPLKLIIIYVLWFSNGTPYSHMEIRFWFKLSYKIISLAFNKVLLLFMFNGSPRNDTMVSSFQGHVQWIWAESFTENLQKRRYSDIAVPKLSELSNFCSVINTQSRWLPNARQVGHHGELKYIFLSNYSPLYPKANFILISLLFFCKKIHGGGSAVYWSIV